MNRRFFETAINQSAADVGCEPSDFFKSENSFYRSSDRRQAKAFYPENIDFLAISCGFGNAVSVREDKFEEISEALKDSKLIFPEDLLSHGFKPAFETICFLPSGDNLPTISCPYAMRFLEPEEFSKLYLPEWSNALSIKRPHLDKLAVGAFDGDILIGLAGASQDAENMLQIGIDVLPDYRKKGVASALTSAIGREIIKIGQTPFYSCNWNNIPSFKNAERAGFTPVWTEISAIFSK